MLRRYLPRLGGQPPGLRDGRRAPRAPALDEREGPGDNATTSAAATAASRMRRRLARRRALSARDPGRPGSPRGSRVRRGRAALLARQLDRSCQPRPAIEIRLVPTRLVPAAGRRRQLALGSELFPILRQPSAQPGPLADQRLVRRSRPSRRPRPAAASPPVARAPPSPPRARPRGSAPSAGLASGCPPSSRPAR